MLDIGWMEFILIAIVALIIIGPKDLPKTLATVSRWIGNIRAMARKFQHGLDDMVRESEIGDIRDQMKEQMDEAEREMSDADPSGDFEEAFDLSEDEASVTRDAKKDAGKETKTKPAARKKTGGNASSKGNSKTGAAGKANAGTKKKTS